MLTFLNTFAVVCGPSILISKIKANSPYYKYFFTLVKYMKQYELFNRKKYVPEN